MSSNLDAAIDCLTDIIITAMLCESPENEAHYYTTLGMVASLGVITAPDNITEEESRHALKRGLDIIDARVETIKATTGVVES